MKADRLNRLRKKGPTPFCHSERSEESLFLFMELNRREILRFAQNDKINYFFRRLFSLPVFVCTSKFKTDRLKPALLEAVQPAVDSQESGIGQHCKNDQNQDERHDRGYVAQVDRVHQKEADALLRGEKFSKDRPQQSQRKSKPQAGENFRNARWHPDAPEHLQARQMHIPDEPHIDKIEVTDRAA